MKETELITQLKNGEAIPLDRVPVLDYTSFFGFIYDLLQIDSCHCVNYFAYDAGKDLKFIMCIADDATQSIGVVSHTLPFKNINRPFMALSRFVNAMHVFEREIHENFAIDYMGHYWLKPLRYPHHRADRRNTIDNYPFLEFNDGVVHEGWTATFQTGIIEPEHFRFICKSDIILLLEIQNGFQHRGIEEAILKKNTLLQRNLLAESISGDTSIGHTMAFVKNMEVLAALHVPEQTSTERSIALEIERIANHLGGLSAICTAANCPLGGDLFNVLKTSMLDFFQLWCGNRMGKGLIRTGGSHYPLNNFLKQKLHQILNDFQPKFVTLSEEIFTEEAIGRKLERCGAVDSMHANALGVVGIVARMCGIPRDVRNTHPFEQYVNTKVEPVLMKNGDVMARVMVRKYEIEQSIRFIKLFLDLHEAIDVSKLPENKPIKLVKMKPDHLCISMTESWRGEAAHCAITDAEGELIHYKIKDPSLHNFLAMELAFRNQKTTEFPINYNSFDLSYCGLDL